MKAYEDVRRDMKINKGIAVAVAALSIVGLAACGNSNATSGTTDTKADKGLDMLSATPSPTTPIISLTTASQSSSSTGAGAARARILSTR